MFFPDILLQLFVHTLLSSFFTPQQSQECVLADAGVQGCVPSFALMTVTAPVMRNAATMDADTSASHHTQVRYVTTPPVCAATSMHWHLLNTVCVCGVPVKPGRCALPQGTPMCAEYCYHDGQCPGEQKCCRTTCGHACSEPCWLDSCSLSCICVLVGFVSLMQQGNVLC